MTQDESELKEFFFVMNKLKQKALLAKLLSVGLVAISGLMVAVSIGYMIYKVETLKSGLDDCEESKTAMVNEILNLNISKKQKNQILGFENTEQLQSNDNTISGDIGNTGIQNKNRPSPSPRKTTPTDESTPIAPNPITTVSPKPNITTEAESPKVSNQNKKTESTDTNTKPVQTNTKVPPVNVNKLPSQPNKECEEIRSKLKAALDIKDRENIIKWSILRKNKGC